MINTQTLYKLIILYILDRAKTPISMTQISDFLLMQEYTNALTLQSVTVELKEDGYITTENKSHREFLNITPTGHDTLHLFEKDINYQIRNDIDEFLKENRVELLNEFSVMSDYKKTSNSDYEVSLTATERSFPLFGVTLNVPTKELAESICDNWKKKNEEIYAYLVKELF